MSTDIATGLGTVETNIILEEKQINGDINNEYEDHDNDEDGDDYDDGENFNDDT